MNSASTIPVVTCSACGYSNIPGEMFCQNCGVQLPPVVSLPPPPPTPIARTPAPDKSQQSFQASQEDASHPAQAALPGSARTTEGNRSWSRLILRDQGGEIPLPPNSSELVIGRADTVQNIFPDIDLTEYGGEKNGVSRRHARILFRQDGIYLEDLNSTNFTFLNREKVEPGEPRPLKHGDEIRLGLLNLEYCLP